MPLVMEALAPVVLPAPFPAQHQRAETLSYLLAFGVILPAAPSSPGDGCATRSPPARTRPR